ncbi:MAG: class I SAM-dependent methyltransferase [Candidatus Kariarchaeaceae archaeon]|jgi:SAM-dependent methyltransferase
MKTERNITNPLTACPVCDKHMNYEGAEKYYGREKSYLTPIYFCSYCNLFFRNVDPKVLNEHLSVASYVRKENEQKFFNERRGFFKYLISILKKHINKDNKTSILDFGCSYGHFLELASQEGFDCVGVEQNDDCIRYCRQKGLQVFKSIDETFEKFDAIIGIDSLYYICDCKKVICKMKSLLCFDGILLFRITNRNFYAKFRKTILKKSNYSIGDATISYSKKAFLSLLEDCGFDTVSIIPDAGIGKKLNLGRRLYYLFTYFLTIITGKKLFICPGIIFVAKIKK